MRKFAALITKATDLIYKQYSKNNKICEKEKVKKHKILHQ